MTTGITFEYSSSRIGDLGFEIGAHQGMLHAYVGAHAPASGVISAIPKKGG
jgi:hypothetical protein